MPEETARRFAHVTFSALSDVGRHRANNEDAHGEWPAQGVFCVADGMGGPEDGEVASRAIVETLDTMLPRWGAYDPPVASPDRLAALDRALDAASARIRDYADSHSKKGCGSTIVVVSLDPADPTRATALHAGDSRAYRLHGHRLSLITRDHSVASLVGVRDERSLAPALRSLVLRAVGTDFRVELEHTPFDIAEGDRILLCSDGLTRMVSDREIAHLLVASPSPASAAAALVAAANAAGGDDNTTVVVLRIGSLAKPPLPVHARLSSAEADALFDGIPFSSPRPPPPPVPCEPPPEETTSPLSLPDEDPSPDTASTVPDRGLRPASTVPDRGLRPASTVLNRGLRPASTVLNRGLRPAYLFFRRHRIAVSFLALLVLLFLSVFVGLAVARVRAASNAEVPVRTAEPPPLIEP